MMFDLREVDWALQQSNQTTSQICSLISSNSEMGLFRHFDIEFFSYRDQIRLYQDILTISLLLNGYRANG